MIDSLAIHAGDQLFHCDVCVIGGGPAGIAIARELLESNARVLLVESGGEAPEPSTNVLNPGEAAGAPFGGFERGRCRALGGTTWLWAGQCLPLEREAFEARNWVPDSGWPLESAELDRYYERAARFLDIPSDALREDAWRQLRLNPPSLDDGLLHSRFSVFTRPNVGRRYRSTFSRARTLRVLLHATATRLRLSASGSVATEVELSTLDRKRACVRARVFVLCCGAIENARLLLVSGLGNRLPALGRYFQDHLAAPCAGIRSSEPRRVQDLFGPLHRRRMRFGPRLRLASALQRSAEVLTCDAMISWMSPPAVVAIRNMSANLGSPQAVAGELPTVIRDLSGLVETVRRRRRGLSSAPAASDLTLVVFPEQGPTPDSQLSVTREPDVLGVPRAKLSWRLGDIELRTMQVMVQAIRSEFARLNLGVVEPSDWLADSQSWSAHIQDTHHHAGTTRMSRDSSRGVVDKNCQVHDVDNLFVAGNSVFPTSGAANPTLANVSLAIRLADHLKSSRLVGSGSGY